MDKSQGQLAGPPRDTLAAPEVTDAGCAVSMERHRESDRCSLGTTCLRLSRELPVTWESPAAGEAPGP